MLCEDGYYRKGSSIGTRGTGCLSCENNGHVVAATMTFLVITLAIVLALFVYGRRTFHVLRPMFRALGKPVQVEPMKSTLKAPGTNPLNLKYHELLSSFAFNFILCRFQVEPMKPTLKAPGTRL